MANDPRTMDSLRESIESLEKEISELPSIDEAQAQVSATETEPRERKKELLNRQKNYLLARIKAEKRRNEYAYNEEDLIDDIKNL